MCLLKKAETEAACLVYTLTLKVTELPNISLQSATTLLLHTYDVYYNASNSIPYKQYKIRLNQYEASWNVMFVIDVFGGQSSKQFHT